MLHQSNRCKLDVIYLFVRLVSNAVMKLKCQLAFICVRYTRWHRRTPDVVVVRVCDEQLKSKDLAVVQLNENDCSKHY